MKYFALALIVTVLTAAPARAQDYIHGNPGTTYRSLGDTTFSSDGTTCRTIGNSTFCN